MNNFWEFRNISETEGELILYGQIASSKPWWADEGEGIYANQFTKDLKALGNISHLVMRINSGGGDVFAANAIYAQLKAHPAKVTGIIEGVAASAATILLAACDIVKAWSNATIMVHDPLAGLMGYYNKKDLEKVGDVLDTVKSSIINGYISKTGRTAEELSALMDQEKWMTAEEAMAEGFVDEIMDDVIVEASMTKDNRFVVVNSIAHDLSGFNTRPTFTSAPGLIQSLQSPQNVAQQGSKNENQKESDGVPITNIEELKNEYPQLCNQLVEQAVKNAVETERNRMKEIDEISNTVSPELVNKAKYEEPMDAGKLAFMALKEDAGRGEVFIQARQQELQNNGGVKPENSPSDADQKKVQESANIDAIANAMNARRGGTELTK
ncbi:head maturation protease, ClpP-related [Paenibacillus bouchesdurhonensis]|uniref:head maturation protease, ClpP-related n=1 Tax=Paenibacillus bouchesdurhonensis TaxID=1870990 RepID=UPI000DA6402D|nr:head maturation protease, ClpP-related [Paenibacillus bouchesdurhonensis]